MNATESNEPERLWTVDETAKYLHMTTSWVYRHTASGDIPHAKMGGLIRYSPTRVREYAEKLHAQASSPNVVSLAARRRKGGR